MDEKKAEQEILSVVGKFPDGASIGEICAKLGQQITQRTVQRRLKLLVNEHLLQRTGRGRAIRYHAIAPPPESVSRLDLPLSPEAQAVLSLVQRPRAERQTVGYDSAFLNDYVPNHTSYLSAAERTRLWEMSGGIEGDLPAGTYARRVMDRLLIDLSWNSSRLEGNTYSFLETARLLKEGKSASQKSTREAQMILNHKAAIEYLIEEAEGLTYHPYTIRNIHAVLSENLMGDPAASGRIRSIPVGISGTSYQPASIPSVIEECLHDILTKSGAINDPFEASFFLMVHLPYLQPFEDVNKRTSRIAGNIPLLKANLCPLSFVDVPTDAYIAGLIAIYKGIGIHLLKDVFLWAYLRSTQRYATIQHQLGEPDPFRARHRDSIKHLVRKVVEDRLSQMEATQFIQQWATTHLEVPGRMRFVEAVEQELLNLDPGNIARYRLRPSVLAAWQEVWNG